MSSPPAPPEAALPGGSGFGAGTSFRFWPCAQCTVGRSDKFGDTAELDGRDTLGAEEFVCAEALATPAATKTAAPKMLTIIRDFIEFAPRYGLRPGICRL
jgi:hypothetical protein